MEWSIAWVLRNLFGVVHVSLHYCNFEFHCIISKLVAFRYRSFHFDSSIDLASSFAFTHTYFVGHAFACCYCFAYWIMSVNFWNCGFVRSSLLFDSDQNLSFSFGTDNFCSHSFFDTYPSSFALMAMSFDFGGDRLTNDFFGPSGKACYYHWAHNLAILHKTVRTAVPEDGYHSHHGYRNCYSDEETGTFKASSRIDLDHVHCRWNPLPVACFV